MPFYMPSDPHGASVLCAAVRISTATVHKAGAFRTALLRSCFLILLSIVLTTGCASPSTHVKIPPRPRWSFPADARITERAILTARGREYPMNGFLVSSETGGLRLVVTESFGQMLADVLVQPNGE